MIGRPRFGEPALRHHAHSVVVLLRSRDQNKMSTSNSVNLWRAQSIGLALTGGRIRTMKLADFLVREAIVTNLLATTKEEAIREIVRSLQNAGYVAGGSGRASTSQILIPATARHSNCPMARCSSPTRAAADILPLTQGICRYGCSAFAFAPTIPVSTYFQR